MVWQGLMVEGMVHALIGSFAVVLVMMVLLFRSLRYGLRAMLPLALTIAVIYAVLGLVGKDYDMPVAVLSSLALGLSGWDTPIGTPPQRATQAPAAAEAEPALSLHGFSEGAFDTRTANSRVSDDALVLAEARGRLGRGPRASPAAGRPGG